MSKFKFKDFVHEDDHGSTLFQVLSVEGSEVTCVNHNPKDQEVYIFHEDNLTNSEDIDYAGMQSSD
jgi:hypothetical protein